MKASDVLADAVRTLKASPAIDHWQKDREEIEADDLLCHVLDVDDVEPDAQVSAAQRRRFHQMVERRATGEPVQLIKGYAVFRGLEILSRPGVFVPRDSTEFLAELAIRRLRGRRRPVAVDIATGGGTVALAIADEVRRPCSRTTSRARRSRVAIRAYASRNFLVGDLFGALLPGTAGST
jgi:release factor glutamine methyltransferase